MTGVQIHFTRSKLKETNLEAFKPNGEFMNALGQNGKKSDREKILDKLEKHQMAKVAASLLSFLISGSDIVVLFFAFGELSVLTKHSSTLSNTFLAFSGCFQGLSVLLQSESAKLTQPDTLKNSFNTFFFLALSLRFIILIWNPISFFMSDKAFKQVLKDLQAIDPQASVIRKISEVFWNIIKGTHQVAPPAQPAEDQEDKVPLKSDLRAGATKSTTGKKDTKMVNIPVRAQSGLDQQGDREDASADCPALGQRQQLGSQRRLEQAGTAQSGSLSASVLEGHITLRLADPAGRQPSQRGLSVREVELQSLRASQVDAMPVPDEGMET